MRRALTLAGLLSAFSGCGGSPASPTHVVYDVPARVYYDVNGNGVRDPDETAVVPGAVVLIGTHGGTAAPGTGELTVHGVAAGSYQATLDASSLPPYYEPGAPVPLSVPLPNPPLDVPVTLPIETNHPNVYMAFGDSITDGDGSSDDSGYRSLLAPKLQGHFGAGTIVNQAIGGTRSITGANRIQASLDSVHPAYTLILYGTNDWNDIRCRNDPPCYTIDSLRAMIESVKAAHGLPVVGTITPANTGYDARTPPSRNVWVAQMNDLIRPMAKEEGAVLADFYAVFMAQDDFHNYLFDHVHPNDAGYQLIAGEYFRAITAPPSASPAPSPSPSPAAAAEAFYRPPQERGPYRIVP